MLTQRDQSGCSNIMEYASCPLTDTESRCSQTESEMLGVVWEVGHFEIYLKGDTFTVVTDHQPSLGILKKTTARPRARLERLLLRLQP